MRMPRPGKGSYRHAVTARSSDSFVISWLTQYTMPGYPQKHVREHVRYVSRDAAEQKQCEDNFQHVISIPNQVRILKAVNTYVSRGY